MEAVESYWLTLACSQSTWHRVMSTIEAKGLADAERRATLALRALRKSHDAGTAWDRWVIQVRKPTTGLPQTVAVGGPQGTEYSIRFDTYRSRRAQR